MSKAKEGCFITKTNYRLSHRHLEKVEEGEHAGRVIQGDPRLRRSSIVGVCHGTRGKHTLGANPKANSQTCKRHSKLGRFINGWNAEAHSIPKHTSVCTIKHRQSCECWRIAAASPLAKYMRRQTNAGCDNTCLSALGQECIVQIDRQGWTSRRQGWMGARQMQGMAACCSKPIASR